MSANYTYTDDLLTAIQTPSTTYSFTYGDFDLRTSVKAGYNTLAEYTYTNDKNRYLSALDYGNGDSVQYTYDDKGRLVTQTYEDGDNLYHKYDNSGNLASVWDSGTARTTYYYYDLTDRMMKYVEKGDDGYSHSVGYEYNKLNNLTQQVETINGVNHTTSYSYDDDNRVETVTTGGVTVTYTYDDLGRVSKQETKNGDTLILTEEFTYTAPEDGKTSSQIATYTTTASGYSVTYSYTYDDNGNILSISDGSKTTSYVYDSANQLIRANNQAEGYTHTWEYDAAGNILNRKQYSYTTGSLAGIATTDWDSYVYGDENWGDLLTEYNGNDIDHDELGNLVYDGEWDYAWEHGRQLKSMTHGNTGWEYEYNADGMRTKRSQGIMPYTYVYNGSQLTQMDYDGFTFDFTYDANGTPLTVSVNSSTYYYVTNIQGDVTAILDSDGDIAATYTYDAWGVCTTTGTDSIANYNPLRYRGYIYDIETGLYYVSSRYYDPEIGRFINADSLVTTGQGVLGQNMFAYCLNNPVCRIDILGFVSVEVAKRLIQDNADSIIDAGEEFGVDPVIIAGCIYTEQVLNVDWKDTVTDLPLSFLDTSIGIGQVKVSTAIKLEKLGYIQRTPQFNRLSIGIPYYKMVSFRLIDKKANIRYVAAYLKAWQDVWKSTLDISSMPGVLGTLYNLGERANRPNRWPKMNDFGRFAEDNYDMLKELLGL